MFRRSGTYTPRSFRSATTENVKGEGKREPGEGEGAFLEKGPVSPPGTPTPHPQRSFDFIETLFHSFPPSFEGGREVWKAKEREDERRCALSFKHNLRRGLPQGPDNGKYKLYIERGCKLYSGPTALLYTYTQSACFLCPTPDGDFPPRGLPTRSKVILSSTLSPSPSSTSKTKTPSGILLPFRAFGGRTGGAPRARYITAPEHGDTFLIEKKRKN